VEGPVRALGSTGFEVFPIGFGAWAVGGDWGPTDDVQAMRALHAAVDAGVNFIDTADVYGDGRSERLVGRLLRERPGEHIIVATKAGRRLSAQAPEGYSRKNLTNWIDRSLTNLGVERIDLLQLHCPHTRVYDMPEVFGILDDLSAAGKLRHHGVSVETVDEARRALRHPNVRTLQIIFNIFRPRPAEEFFRDAHARRVGIIARVPLASGLLTGKLGVGSRFAADDHRTYNREGQAFDKGETFSGVPYDVGLEAVERLRPLVPSGATLTLLALQWILTFDEVSCTIPGARTPEQARENAAAALLPRLDAKTMTAVRAVYDDLIRVTVHANW
jgi:aryl-alcohol dehydrogenase-like predicted oxidoreductase